MLKVFLSVVCAQVFILWRADAAALRCFYDGEFREAGEVFFTKDCNNCTCQHTGGATCVATACHEVTCTNFFIPMGSCCRVCAGVTIY
ncbi:hypothetical protein BsWGS_19027 [Bradybaena similaris]